MSPLPSTAFIDPNGDNRNEIELLLHQAIEMLVAEMSNAGQRSPLPEPLATDQLASWANIPEKSVDSEALLKAVRSQLQRSMNAAHPGYIGHMDSIPSTVSIVGDLLVAALNNNMLSVEMSPVFSRLEPLVMKQLAALFGLGPAAGGVMVSGGSLANLQALTVARNVAFDAVKTGVVGLRSQPVFLVSEVAHTSMQKAAMVMGLGSQAAIAVRTNSNSQMDVGDLKSKLVEVKSQGKTPFAVVATVGTTVTGSIDPIADIAQIAKGAGLWFHVDAAYGGALAFDPDYRHQLVGIDQADSVTFNPQKWLYVTKTCATVLFRRFDTLSQYFRISAPYMGDHDAWPNLGELTVQGTRHPDILKLWLSLQHFGKQGYRHIIRHNMAMTHHMVEAINRRPYLQLASQPQMNVVCFRLAPEAIASSHWDQLNAGAQAHLLKSRPPVFLSLPTYRKERWLKAVLLNPFTRAHTIDSLFKALDSYIQANQKLTASAGHYS